MMKKLILKTVASVLFLSTSALAYDVDTHFYGTYSMARFAGIRHEVAVKIATGAQWMDESYISDPLSMILLPDVGIKKRRLLHFPGPRETVSFDPNKLPSFLDPSTGEPLNLKLFTETVADDPFASEMITEGLLTGNLMMVSTGIHTLEDSFAHAGTIAELGHAHFWHHPDRPYVDQESIQKYFKMTTEVLKAMVAIRTLLPSNGLDYDLQLGERKNFQMTANELAEAYQNNQKIRNTVSYNVLKDSRYVAEALKFLFAKAYVAGYIIDDINLKDAKGLVKKYQYGAYLNKFTNGQDAYEAGVSVARAMPSNLLNLPKILKDTTGRTTLTTDDIKSFGGMGALYAKTLHPFLSGFVPRALDEYHKFEKENDTDPAGKAIYDKENEVRNNNMRALIVNLYKNDIIFKKNSSSSQGGFLKELAKSPDVDFKQYTNKNNVFVVSYSLKEKHQFNHMIFRYLFPKLSAYVNYNEAELDNMAKLVVTKKDASYLGKAKDFGGALLSILAQKLSLSDMENRIKIAHEDIMHSRIQPNILNKHYKRADTLNNRIIDPDESRRFKMLMSSEDMNVLINTGVVPE